MHHLKRNPFTLSLLLLVLGMTVAARAASDFDAFLLMNQVPGEATEINHKDWIQVLGLSHAMIQPGSGKTRHTDVNLFKQLDKASPLLSLYCNDGRKIPFARIEFIRTSADRARFYQIILTNVSVTQVDSSGGGGGVPLETIGLGYERIDWTYTEIDARGARKSEISAYWSLIANQGGLLGLTVSLRNLPGGAARLSWNSTAGKTYEIRACPTVDGAYQFFQSVPSAGTGQTSIDVPAAATAQFFLVIEQ